ncbi:MAG: hypothetical protein N2438_08170 [Limisphaera sp.]|nr:hypothetical protein [Limisphaera sp.]
MVCASKQRRWQGLVMLLAVLSCGAAGRAAEASSGSPTPAVPAPVIPRSVFEIPGDPSQGRDPFFPRSQRLFAGRTGSTNVTPVARIQWTLRGLAGTPQQRLATLRTSGDRPRTLILAEGEETSLPAAGGEVRVRCVQIRDDTVVIEVNGVQQELRLRDGF